MKKNLYYLVNRKWFDKIYDQKMYCEDKVIYIFGDEADYVDYIKCNVFQNFAGLPMKNLCCKTFIGLTLDEVYNIGIQYDKNGYDPEYTAKVYKEVNNKFINKQRLIKYGNIFDEVSFNDRSRYFFLENIIDYGNGKGKFFDIPLIKDQFGNWVEWKNQLII